MGLDRREKKKFIICNILFWIGIVMVPNYIAFAEEVNQKNNDTSNVDICAVSVSSGDGVDASSSEGMSGGNSVSSGNAVDEVGISSGDGATDEVSVSSGNAMEEWVSTEDVEENNIGQIVDDAYEQHKLSVPNDVISVTLPTSESFYHPFTIDPQGVLSIQEDGSECIPEAMGAVVPNTILSVRNTSSFAVSVIMDVYVTKNLETGEPASVRLKTNSEGLSETKNNELFLNMYATGNITDEALAELRSNKRDYALKDNTKFVNCVNITSNGRTEAMEICFHLKEASYQTTAVEDGNILVPDPHIPDNYSQAAFCIGGKVSQKSNWGRFVKFEEDKIALQLVFSIMKYDGDMSDKVEVDSYTAAEPTYFNNEALYDLVEDSGNRVVEMRVPYLIDETLPDLKLPVDLGKGAKRIQIVDVYIVQGEDDEIRLTSGADYDITASGIILKATSDVLWGMRRPTLCTIVLDGRNWDGEEIRMQAAFITKFNGED